MPCAVCKTGRTKKKKKNVINFFYSSSALGPSEEVKWSKSTWMWTSVRFGATVVEKWEKIYVLLFCKVSEVWHEIPIGVRHAKNMFFCTVDWRVDACACVENDIVRAGREQKQFQSCDDATPQHQPLTKLLKLRIRETITFTFMLSRRYGIDVGTHRCAEFLFFFLARHFHVHMSRAYERRTEPRHNILSICCDDVYRDFELQRAIAYFLHPFTKLTISSA